MKDYERHTTCYEQLFMNAHYIILDAMAWITPTTAAEIEPEDAERMANAKRIREIIDELVDCEAKMLLKQRL